MPATPNLFSDSKLIEAAVAFFADAESAVARTVDEVGDAMRDGEGWTSHSGVTFIQRPAVRGSQGALVEAILRKLGPRSGHEDEIRSATWRGAAQWLTASERTPPEDAARLMLRTIGETAEVTADLVIPNYTFRRAQGVSGARIGSVEILESFQNVTHRISLQSQLFTSPRHSTSCRESYSITGMPLKIAGDGGGPLVQRQVSRVRISFVWPGRAQPGYRLALVPDGARYNGEPVREPAEVRFDQHVADHAVRHDYLFRQDGAAMGSQGRWLSFPAWSHLGWTRSS